MVDEFVVAMRPQRAWSSLVAWDLFLGGTGAGLFLLAQILRATGKASAQVSTLSGWLGVALVGAASLVLFAHLGVPLLFWRVLSRPGRSWVSRGAWTITLFSVFAVLTLLPSLPGLEALPWRPNTFVGALIQGAAVILAMALMLYTGLLVSSWNSIPFWNTSLLRLVFVASSLLGAAGAMIALAAAAGGETRLLSLLALALVAVEAFLLLLYLRSMYGREGAAGESARRLLSGEESGSFIAGVLVVGLYVPAVLLAIDMALGLVNPVLLIAAGVAVLVGTLQIRGSLLTVGVFRERGDGL